MSHEPTHHEVVSAINSSDGKGPRHQMLDHLTHIDGKLQIGMGNQNAIDLQTEFNE